MNNSLISCLQEETNLPKELCSIIKEYSQFRTIKKLKFEWQEFKMEEVFSPILHETLLSKEEEGKGGNIVNPVSIEEIQSFPNLPFEILYQSQEHIPFEYTTTHCIVRLLESNIFVYYYEYETGTCDMCTNINIHIQASRDLNSLLDYVLMDRVKDHFLAFQNYKIKKKDLMKWDYWKKLSYLCKKKFSSTKKIKK